MFGLRRRIDREANEAAARMEIARMEIAKRYVESDEERRAAAEERRRAINEMTARQAALAVAMHMNEAGAALHRCNHHLFDKHMALAREYNALAATLTQQEQIASR